MIIRLLPVQIAHHWSIIKYAIVIALPPTIEGTAENMNDILLGLLDGTMHCWVVVEDKKIRMIFTTTIVYDFCSKTRDLLIYTVAGFGGSRGRYKELHETLRKFAAGENCSRIIAYIKDDYLKEIVEWLGGEAEYRLATLPV